jgi:tetraacyldisaccharide 4'-kinase
LDCAFEDGTALMRALFGWWLDEADQLCRLLKPVGAIYGAITAARMKQSGTRAKIPVICIGNFVAGGAGKTPTALALGALLQAQGRNIAFLSRGYCGALASEKPLRVDPAHHKAADVGDEPLLLARLAPTFICTDRVAGASAVSQAGADLVIMDDGLQNPALFKDIRIAVIDGEAGIGNGLCVPAGPLRAPLNAQWPHVDAIVIIGTGKRGDELAQQAQERGKLVLRAQLVPENAELIKDKMIFAFAGIGRPEKFFHFLRQHGAIMSTMQAFDDHHPYTREELERIRRLSCADLPSAETIVTTEKDAMRIPEGALPNLVVLRVNLKFDAQEKLAALIAEKISRG